MAFELITACISSYEYISDFNIKGDLCNTLDDLFWKGSGDCEDMARATCRLFYAYKTFFEEKEEKGKPKWPFNELYNIYNSYEPLCVLCTVTHQSMNTQKNGKNRPQAHCVGAVMKTDRSSIIILESTARVKPISKRSKRPPKEISEFLNVWENKCKYIDVGLIDPVACLSFYKEAVSVFMPEDRRIYHLEKNRKIGVPFKDFFQNPQNITFKEEIEDDNVLKKCNDLFKYENCPMKNVECTDPMDKKKPLLPKVEKNMCFDLYIRKEFETNEVVMKHLSSIKEQFFVERFEHGHNVDTRSVRYRVHVR